MAGGITAAAVWVDVIPSMRGAAKQISRQARQLGQDTGRTVADETARSISQRAAAIGNAIGRTFSQAQAAAVAAGQRIGRAFSGGVDAARAALDRFMTGWGALDAATARSAGMLGRFGAAARSAFDTAARPAQNFIAGFRSADAAASALTGRLGTLGGRARTALDAAARPVQNLVAGFRSSEAAASAFTGRLGTIGGVARSAFNAAAAPLQNFVSGFRSSDAAASAFTGRMGTVGGAIRSAFTNAAAPVQNFVSGLRSSDAAASAFTGRMGSFGGSIRTALATAVQPVHNFTAGFRDANAAASAFSGRMGTVGGAIRSAMSNASQSVSNFAARVNEKAAESANAVSSGLGGALLGIGAKAAGAAAAAVAVGTIGTEALSSASNIQNTQLTLSGLYGSAEKANDMMARLSNLSRSSPIEYAAYANAAKQLAYMGIEGGQAEGVLRNVGAAITAAGGDSSAMDRASSAMLQMVNSGRVYAAQLGQISDAGIPVFSGLAAHFNTNIDNVREMVTAGKVSIEDVMSVIENAEGSTFQSMIAASQQVTGSMSNQWAIFKDNVVHGFGEMLVPLTQAVGPAIGDLGRRIGDAFTRLPGILAEIGRSDWFQSLVAGLRAVWEFGQPIVGFLLQVLGVIGAAAWSTFTSVLGAIGGALAWLLPYLQPLQPIIVGIALAFAGWWAFGAVVSTVVSGLAMLKNALGLVTGAWRVLSLAFTASPIGFIIAVVIGLVAAVIYAYTHFEGFRNVVDACWAAIKSAAAAAWGFLQGVFDGIVAALDWVGNAWNATLDWFAALPGQIGGFFSNAADSVVSFFSALPGRIGSALSTAASAAGDFLARLPQMIAYGLGFAVGAVVRWAVELYGAVVAGFNAVVAWFTALPGRIATWASNAWAQFTTGLATAWDNTVAWFQALPGRIQAFMIGLAASFVTWAITTWNGFTTGLSSAWQATAAWFAALPGRIQVFLVTAGAWLVGTAISMWNGFTAGLSSAWTTTVAWFAALPGRIMGFFVAAGSWLLQVGVDLVLGLWNGLVGAFIGLMTWIGGLISSFINGFKAGLGIASPSTIFAEIGGFLIQGLIAGIQAAAALLWTIITTIAAGVVNFFMAGIQGLAAMWSAVWNGIVAVFSWVWSMIQTIALTVWGWIQSYFTTSLAVYQAFWAAVWNAISGVFTAVWNWIRNTAVTIWNAIVAFFQAGFAFYQGLFSAAWNFVLAVFTNVWNWIKNTAVTIWNAVVAFFTAAFAYYQAYFSAVWNAILAVFTTVWNWIRNTATTIWNAIVAYFQAAFAAWSAFFSLVWNTILNVFRQIWEWLRTTAVNAWNAIYAFFSGAFATFTAFFRNTWQTIVDTFSRIWGSITEIANRVWEGVKNAFKGGVNAVIDVINIFADGINKVAGLLGFDIDLRIPRLEGGGEIVIGTRMAGGPIGLASGGGVNAASGGMLPGRQRPGRDRLPALAGGTQPYLLDGGEYVVQRDSTRAIGKAGMAAINNARRNPVDIIPRQSGGPVLPESAVRDRYPFLTALADGQAEAVGAAQAMGGVNKMLSGLADGNRRAEQAAGTRQRTMQGYRKQFNENMLQPIARDLGGAIAFAKSMNGKPYIWGGTTTAGTDCSGYQGMITRVLRNQSPARIGGTGDFPWPGFTPGLTSSYAIGAFKGNPGHMAGTLDGVNVESGGSHGNIAYGGPAVGADSGQFTIKASLPEVGGVFASGGGGGGGWFSLRPLIEPLLQPIYDALTPIRDNVAEGFGKRSMAGGGIKLMDGILAFADTIGGGGGGGDVESWRPLVLAALQRVGQPASLADITLRRMNQESGGDPRAINNWDSNARRGTPSKGLMQVIDTTFAAHRDPGLPNDIWDPMANVVASMRYALSKYGGLQAAYGRAGGYDSGGIARGRGIMLKDIIADERVLPPRETQSYDTLTRLSQHLDSGVVRAGPADRDTADSTAGRRGDGGPLIGTVNVSTERDEQIARALTWEIRKVKRGGVFSS